ncbi:MAG: PilZ domain-containing protein [Rhodoferax sp.]|nr:PilZ domain-containing protein [Rhodoferax sp.]MBP9683073.1 PilZ domain-containing protein [Rhodoferax sp.]
MSDLTSDLSKSTYKTGSAADAPISSCARAAPRKPLTGRARVSVEGGMAHNGKLVDISESGVGIMLDDPVPAKKVCTVMCETFMDGKRLSFGARAIAAYSVLAGNKGYRIGFQFSALEPATSKIIADLIK